MSNVELLELRREVKQSIDNADEDLLLKIQSLVESETDDDDWWESLPKNIQERIEESERQLDRGEGLTHEKVKQLYPQWFMK